MTNKPLLIAVDGPAASGKGTLAKRLAQYFNLDHLDTGKIYRAVGYKMIKDNLDPNDKELAEQYATSLIDEDLENHNLYNEGIGNAASIISAFPIVREILMSYQKKFAQSAKGAVLDGRDIGTVICTDADFKFFITADIENRAQRRFDQLKLIDQTITYQRVLEDLQRRDDRDTKRNAAPLIRAKDAHHIDTTYMNAEQVFDEALNIILQNSLFLKCNII